MRSNYIGNTALQECRTKRLIVEPAAVDRADIRQKKSHWQAADSTTGFELTDRGTVRLTPSAAVVIQHTSDDGVTSDALDARLGTFQAAQVVFAGADAANLEIYSIRAELDPSIDNVNVDVVWWELHLYVLELQLGSSAVRLVEICEPARVPVASGAAGDFTFNVSARLTRPTPVGQAQRFNPGAPTLIVEIRPINASGGTAGNTGWRNDSATASVVTAGKTLTGVSLTQAADGTWTVTDQVKTPNITINMISVSSATLAFTAAGNRFDLGAAPTATVRAVLWGHVPVGSALQLQVRNDADSAWVNINDGQSFADVGLVQSQTRKWQLIFTAPAGQNATPELVRAGLEDITLRNFDNLHSIDGGGMGVDPLTLKGEIAEATVRFNRDGVPDARDQISELLTTYTREQLEFRVWLGHPDLERRYWMLKNVFTIDDYASPGPTVDCLVISPLADLRQALPPYDSVASPQTISSITRVGQLATVTTAAAHGLMTGQLVVQTGATQAQYNGTFRITVLSATVYTIIVTGTPATPATGAPVYIVPKQRAQVGYQLQALKTALDDLIDNQLGLPARRRGPLIETALGNVTKGISDSDAKIEADCLAYIAGGALIESQGQLKFVPMFSDATVSGEAIRAVIPSSMIRWGAVGPGMKDRQPESFVRYGFGPAPEIQSPTGFIPGGTEAFFRREVRSLHAAALTALGRPRLAAAPRIDEEVEKWLPAEQITSITRSGSTATVTTGAPHNLATGQTVIISGALETEYNSDAAVPPIGFVITVTGATTFTFTVSGTPATPATTNIGITFTPFAHKIAMRITESMGPGLMLLPFATTEAFHELEPGDLVALQTDRFVARDPNVARALRGRLWIIARIQKYLDQSGKRWIAWCQNYANIVAGTEAAQRLGFVTPAVLSVEPTISSTGAVTVVITARDARGVKIAVSTAGYPTKETVQAVAAQALSNDGTLATGTLATIDQTQILYIRVLAYEYPDATGAESSFLGEAKIEGSASLPPGITAIGVSVNHHTGVVTVQVHANTRTASFRYATATGTTSPPAWPSDAAVETGVIQAITGSATLTFVPGITPGQHFRIRMAPYKNADGTGTGGAGDHGNIEAAECQRLEDVRLPYPRPGVKKKSQAFGTTDTTSTKVDVSLEVEYGVGESTTVTVRVWTQKASVSEPDPTGAYEGSFALALSAAGKGTVDQTTSFTLNPGPGSDTLLDDIRVPAGDSRLAKNIYAQVVGADGVEGEIVTIPLFAKVEALRNDGKILRSVAFTDAKYALKASDTAGKETDDDLFITSTKTLKVGTVAAPSSLTKTMRFAMTAFLPYSQANSWIYNATTNPPTLHTNIAGTPMSYMGSFVLPRGITLTAVKLYLHRANAGDLASAVLYRDGTNIATVAQSAGATGVVTTAVSQLVGTENYSIELQLLGVAAIANAYASYLEFDYTMPTYDKGI